MNASALKLLEAADVFYGSDPGEPRELNMNDTFNWGEAWGVEVPDDKIDEVAKLFHRYGFAGLVYWVSEQNNHQRSAFMDINRMIDFVMQEERLREMVPDTNKRAYVNLVYTLGEKGKP